MDTADVLYISDADDKLVSVIVPIQLWREIESRPEIARLLTSEGVRHPLFEAKDHP